MSNYLNYSNFNALKNEQHPIFRRTQESLDRERLNVVGPELIEKSKYNLYQENSLKPNTIRKQAFTGIFNPTLLNQVFMSQANQDLLQERIRYEVYQKSGSKFHIGKQDDIQLQIIMRSIYLQYGKNLPYNTKQQVKDLDDLVVQEAISKIMSEVEAYLYYLERASNLPVPLAHPENMNSAGRKVLPSVTSTFFSNGFSP